jgi:hypothetical protein
MRTDCGIARIAWRLIAKTAALAYSPRPFRVT